MIRIIPIMAIGLAITSIVFFIFGMSIQSDGYIYLIISSGFAAAAVSTGLYIANHGRRNSPLENTVRDI